MTKNGQINSIIPDLFTLATLSQFGRINVTHIVVFGIQAENWCLATKWWYK